MRIQNIRNLVIFSALFLLTSIAAAQTTWHVDGGNTSGPWEGSVENPFQNIQAGIAAAVHGDSVLVAPGIYYEHIEFLGKAITVKSIGGQDGTTIDGGGAGSVVRCIRGEEEDSVLEGFTITNGTGTMWGDYKGGGMFIGTAEGHDYVSSPTVKNCTFSENFADKGGGMYVHANCRPKIINCTFFNNSSNVGGGGMFNWGSSPSVIGCTFSNNATCGIWNRATYTKSYPLIKDCVFSENRHGAITNLAGWALLKPTITNCLFIENYNPGLNAGGGITNLNEEYAHFYYCQPQVSFCTFTGNSAPHGAGGASNLGSVEPYYEDCIFWENTPKEVHSTALADTTLVYSCVRGGHGGAGNINQEPLFVAGPHGDFYLSQVIAGQAAESPCVDAGNTSSPPIDGTTRTDGALDFFVADMGYHYQSESLNVPQKYLTIQDAINAASDGDTICVAPDSANRGPYIENIFFNGKAITVKSTNGPDVTTISGEQTGSVVTFRYGEGESSVLNGFLITNGTGTPGNDGYGNGGGMYIEGCSPTVTGCIIRGNAANRGGGIFSLSAAPIVNNCTFHGNAADHGGGMYNSAAESMVTFCTFSENTAAWGGGMYNSNSSSPTVTFCAFTENSAPLGGGMYNHTGSPKVINCMFTDNSALLGGGMNSNAGYPDVSNCIFSGNSAYFGGGLCNWMTSLVVTNCTISDNIASYGGAMLNYFGSLVATNCILWNDTPGEIFNYRTSPTLNYCCIQGGWPGEGNFSSDPLFAAGPLGDYYLCQISAGQGIDSPCIDAGCPSSEMIEGTTRTDGVNDQGIVDTGFHYSTQQP